MTTPFIKWPGGKRRLTPQILKALGPLDNKTYYEPFLGAGAVALACGAEDMHLSDACGGLINTWRGVQRKPFVVFATLQDLHAPGWGRIENPAARYYEVRSLYNAEPRAGVQSAARFLYLNRNGFNGLYRENAGGRCNVPWGHKEPCGVPLPALQAASLRVQGARFWCRDWREALRSAGSCKNRAAIYLDPPYFDGFTNYCASKWSLSELQDLAKWSAELASYGAKVVISHSDCPEIRELCLNYGFSFEEVLVGRSISRDGGGRVPVAELIITCGG